MDNDAVVRFIFEMGQLRRIRHEGFSLIGVDHLDTVAEHSLRAAQLGYFLARMEQYPEPYEVVTALVFHDIGECRVGDVHKVANRYLMVNESQAVKDQLARFKEEAEEIYRLWSAVEEKKTVMGRIAKDADYLELAFTSKEFVEKGYAFAQDWIDNIRTLVQTKSAKKLLLKMVKSDSNDWWQGLKKLDKNHY